MFECLTKLGTTAEKRLMIDVLALRESYERRQISEIRWITGGTNPADALTKKNKTETALRELVSTNRYAMQEEGRVTREHKQQQQEDQEQQEPEQSSH
jgi:G3E family GTPase